METPNNSIPPFLSNTVSVHQFNDDFYVLEFGFCPNYDGTDYEGTAIPHTRILITPDLLRFLGELSAKELSDEGD